MLLLLPLLLLLLLLSLLLLLLLLPLLLLSPPEHVHLSPQPRRLSLRLHAPLLGINELSTHLRSREGQHLGGDTHTRTYART